MRQHLSTASREPDHPGAPAAEPEGSAAPAARERALTLRSLLLAMLFGALGCWWVMQTSVIHYSAHVGGSVPPIPAIATLLLLALVNPLFRRWGLNRSETLFIYTFVAIAVIVPDPNSLLIYLFAFITAPHYFNKPEMGFGSAAEALPAWFAPKDHALMRRFYDAEGAPAVDWGAWALPLLGWAAFLLALWITTYAALSLFRERWLHHDRLRFPIVDLVTDLSAPKGQTPPFLLDRVMWLGFGLAALHNLLNIGAAFDPKIPSAGRFVDLGAALTQPPWNALSPIWVSLRPEIFGIGYLISLDVLFTAWLSYLLLRLSNVARTAMGHEVVSTPYDYQEMAAGAYVGIFAALVWLARKPLWNAVVGVRCWVLGATPPDPPSERGGSARRLPPDSAALLAALAGFAYMVWWLWRAGMGWWVAVLYLGLIVSFALVYSRIRAETGAPLMFLFPFWQQQKMLLHFLGGTTLAQSGPATLPILAALGFLARGSFPQYAAFQLEAMEMGERVRARSRHMAAGVFLALLFGLAVGYYLVLTNAYRLGFNQLDGGGGGGGYRVFLARQQFSEIAQWQSGRQASPDLSLILQTLLGLGIAVGINLLRTSWLGSPLHPLGFAMSASYGFHLWAPFLAVWLCKLFILKAGGMRLYRRLIPFFLGIVLGHYMVSGILWGGLSVFAPGLTHQYVVHFS